MEDIKIIVDDCSKVVVNGIEITSVEEMKEFVKEYEQKHNISKENI